MLDKYNSCFFIPLSFLLEKTFLQLQINVAEVVALRVVCGALLNIGDEKFLLKY